MTMRRRLVRVPASSANLGPGYDVLAVALQLYLELEVTETGEFSVVADGLDVPLDRSNLIVRAFESLHPADGLQFDIRSEIPLAAGLGSSASAIVAGLLAADHMFELGNSREQLLARASEIEGHPDNVAAALYGGVVVCAPPDTVNGELDGPPAPASLAPPEGVEAIIVTANHEVETEQARKAIPEFVPVADAAANVAAASHLVLGIERSDLTLIRRGLADRLHQPYREHLYPRSMELVREATELGAIGATISGAGPTVLVWSYWQVSGSVAEALTERTAGWGAVQRVPFSPDGADVPEL